jgi:hypothetical protein
MNEESKKDSSKPEQIEPAELTETSLDQAVGGSAACQGEHLPKQVLDARAVAGATLDKSTPKLSN